MTTKALRKPVGGSAHRLWSQVALRANGCAEWTGAVGGPGGYGQISVNGQMLLTHRLAWELTNGPIPTGMQVLHHCDNPPCCNARKCLFLGTDADNMADMLAKGRHNNQKKTHCHAGHPFDEANTRVTRAGRDCRACALIRRQLTQVA